MTFDEIKGFHGFIVEITMNDGCKFEGLIIRFDFDIKTLKVYSLTLIDDDYQFEKINPENIDSILKLKQHKE